MILGARVVGDHLCLPVASAATPEDIELSIQFLILCDGGGFVSQKRMVEIREFVAIFNGGFSRWMSEEHFIHVGTRVISEIKRLMLEQIILFLLNRRPEIPALARWAKVR